MKAKLEEARLLESAGRREEALAALREVATIHEQALAQAKAVRESPAPPAAPRVVPRALREPIRRVPIGPNAAIPLEPRRAPKADPTPAAVRWLLRVQWPSGHFGATATPVDPETTAFCVVALLDAVEDDATEALSAVHRGAQALAALPSHAISDPALVAWALAAAYARLGEPAWRDPILRLVDRVARGEVVRGQDPPAEGALRALWTLACLGEVGPLHQTVPETVGLDAVHAEVVALARRLEPIPEAAGAFARDLLRLEADLPDDAPGARTPAGDVALDGARPVGSWIRGPGTIHDPLALLLGTVYLRARFGTDDPREGTVWWNRVLLRAVDRQVTTGAEAGSWEPGDARSQAKGRVWTTAVTLLAWRAWDVPWREPVAP
jgi:hypothetical protein